MKPVVVIKIGGKAASGSAVNALIREMASLKKEYSFCFVHGGGAEVTRVSEVFGLKANFKDGIRQTTEPEMEVVDMVLAGRMNTQLVRQMGVAGIKAVGLTGADGFLFTGKQIAPDTLTGEITDTDCGVVNILLNGGYLPVLSSVSMTKEGIALNINADEAALEIAKTLKADMLVYISDIPGVLCNGECLPALDRQRSNSLIADGTIGGGMIPKVRSCLGALEKGVGSVVISDFAKEGDLSSLLHGKKGTSFSL